MRSRTSIVALTVALLATTTLWVDSTLRSAPVAALSSPAASVDSAVGSDALPSAGCGNSSVIAGEANVTTQSGGVDRTYLRYLPPAHDGETPLPLVVDIHGFLQGAALQKQNSDWAPRADADGFVVVYPQGIDSRWDPAIDGPDVAYIGHLFNEVEAQLCIDTNRIYVTGFSLGAFMTSTVACVYADRVAAVAPVAWARYPVTAPECSAARPLPFLTIHGTLDTWVAYAPIPGNVAAWAERNGCGALPAEESIPGDDVVTIKRIEYPCPVGVEAIFYDIENGGHAWPGSEFSRAIAAAVGYTTFAFTASDVIWEFFEPHRVHPGIVTYTGRISARQFAALDAIADARGESVEDVVRAGADAFRALAEQGGATPGPQAPNDGAKWVTVAYPASELAAIEAAATAWGADGDELHHAGGRLVLVIVHLAALGRL